MPCGCGKFSSFLSQLIVFNKLYDICLWMNACLRISHEVDRFSEDMDFPCWRLIPCFVRIPVSTPLPPSLPLRSNSAPLRPGKKQRTGPPPFIFLIHSLFEIHSWSAFPIFEKNVERPFLLNGGSQKKSLLTHVWQAMAVERQEILFIDSQQ